MIKQFIFDIGNVLVDFHPQAYFENAMPNKNMEVVCNLVFDEIWTQLDKGTYLQAEAMRLHIERNPEYEEEIRYIYNHWLSMMKLKNDTFQFMKDVKEKGFKVYLLSNIGIESHMYLASNYDFFQLADGMVLSYQEHCLKPNKELYEILLQRFAIQPEECIFFDDSEKNVQMACTLGIHAFVFKGMAQVKKEIDSLW